ncbi:hypothetical protein HYH03_000437 [Edaphochlamys debaryana]|uniref:Uncharacterized protein n=1 Tax=Edaphochlamys debaryana TaxID=47281 RepID=A0A836C7E6_9CHLO|nr:hypothetical protein HYH03_000437 [Edaphochlamys debaryana]|eukprot:KAG2501939.1 hypothetical protein HYH03_000437 [Edaphochlamys debaryana]
MSPEYLSCADDPFNALLLQFNLGKDDAPKRVRGGTKPLRYRQRVLAQLEEACAAKAKELAIQEEENRRLRGRAKVLEVVLPVREQYLQSLQRYRRDAGPSSSDTPFTPYSGHQHPHLTMLNSSGSEESLLSFSSDSLPPLSPAEAGTYAPDHGASTAETSHPVPRPLSTAVEPGPGPAGTPAHVIKGFLGHWREWVREAGLLLHQHDARPSDPGPTLKLAQLHDKLLTPLIAKIQVSHPTLHWDLMQLDLDTGARVVPPAESYWGPVVRSLGFSPAQLEGCRAALDMYREYVARLQEERRALAARLALCTGSPTPWSPAPGQPAALWAHPSEAFAVMEVAEALARNVAKERRALETVKDFFCSNEWSLLQAVRVSVLSYPFIPDPLALVASAVDMHPLTATCAPPPPPAGPAGAQSLYAMAR